MAFIGGLQGGAVNPNTGGIRPPVGEGQGVARPGAQQTPQIPNGAVVEGLVVGKDGEAYQVRIGAHILNARSTIPLFVGQRFRAAWDSSAAPPMLRLQQTDLAVLSRFSGRDQQIAQALLTRGLPVNDDVIWTLRQQWMQNGGNPSKLGVLAELWARGAAMTEGNVALLVWYMELSPDRAMQIWKKIKDRLHSRKFNSPRELLEALRNEGDEDVRDFLRAHALAGKPARRGLDPAMLLAPAWWPLDDD
ncbi:MAG: flagellar hook-length control protein FliK, partial [Synergistaceae bacterium]|nr:flagellar hook-length control protein FliK [Synergistaceae bacterium]